MARLYADEDFPFPVVERLRKLGHDVLTAFDAGQANQGIEDSAQLAFATTLDHAIFTRNRRHFMTLHRHSVCHSGIVSITDDPDLDGQATRIDQALRGYTTLADHHVRVNRPNLPSKP
jgi:hypothetical protein